MKSLAVLFAMMVGVLLFSAPAQAWDPPDATGVTNGAVGGVQVQSPPDPPKIDLDIKVHDMHQRAWYQSPVWLAIVGLGVVVAILLVAMMARGGGTTVVRG